MKKLASVLTCTLLISYAHAQNEQKVFKPFRVDVNFGTAIPSGRGNNVGVSFGIEPKYAVNDLIQIGLRMEADVMVRGVEDVNSVSVSGTANSCYTATGDYYFNSNKFRPFAGMGIGICRLTSLNIKTYDVNLGSSEYTTSSESKFESMIRAGFEYGHGRLALEYNYIPKTTATSSQNSTVIIRNSYFNIKLGVAIGGGRLKK